MTVKGIFLYAPQAFMLHHFVTAGLTNMASGILQCMPFMSILWSYVFIICLFIDKLNFDYAALNDRTVSEYWLGKTAEESVSEVLLPHLYRVPEELHQKSQSSGRDLGRDPLPPRIQSRSVTQSTATVRSILWHLINRLRMPLAYVPLMRLKIGL
jgi:hypothetical protein